MRGAEADVVDALPPRGGRLHRETAHARSDHEPHSTQKSPLGALWAALGGAPDGSAVGLCRTDIVDPDGFRRVDAVGHRRNGRYRQGQRRRFGDPRWVWWVRRLHRPEWVWWFGQPWHWLRRR